MKRKIIKKTAIIMFVIITAYLTIGYLFHSVIFPEDKPDVSTWFKPGQELYSRTEGFRQTIIKQENGFVHCTLEIEPYASGPPKHIHTDFDETFQIENGELTFWINGKIKKIKPGEVIHIARGTPHKPFNETADTIRTKGTFAFPEEFAFNLTQLYSVTDNQPGFERSPKAILQMPLFQRSGFDAYVEEGPPVFIQKLTGFVITPLARMLGYKSYYKKYDPYLNNKH